MHLMLVCIFGIMLALIGLGAGIDAILSNQCKILELLEKKE